MAAAVDALLRRFAARPQPVPDSLSISIDETARLQPRGVLPPLSEKFDKFQTTPQEAREIPIEIAPSAGPTELEVTGDQLQDLAAQVRSEQLATDAGRDFLADHPDTLQSFRLEPRP